MNIEKLIYVVRQCWGTEKTIKSFLISIASGIITFSVCACAIPSEPYEYISIEEKENKE